MLNERGRELLLVVRGVYSHTPPINDQFGSGKIIF